MQDTQTQNKCENCINQNSITQQYKQDSKDYISNESLQNNKIYLKCAQCQVIKCRQCFEMHIVQKHTLQKKEKQLKQDLLKNQFCDIVCQQCQQKDSKKFCQNCQQHLCQNCSFRIHNKGKRAKHQVLDNNNLIRFKNLFMLNYKDTQQIFIQSVQQNQYLKIDSIHPHNSVIVYGGQRPSFIQDFQSLQVQNINKIKIEQLQSILNRYPLIKECSVSQQNQILLKYLKQLVIQNQNSNIYEKKENYIYVNGCKIRLIIRKKKSIQNNNQKGSFQKININIINSTNQQYFQLSLDKIKLRTNPQLSNSPSPSSDYQYIKKQSNQQLQIDKNYQSQIQNSNNIDSNFKKQLKLSNRSLIIEIPETKKYRQSPIKSDRQQGFIQRYQKKTNQNSINDDKTLTINMNSNYYDISETSTANILQNQSQYKSSNNQSILLRGSVYNQKDNSFKIINTQNSYFQNTNEQDDCENSQDINNTHIIISFSELNPNNISLLTDNSIKKKKIKLPLPYYQPLKGKNIQSSNNYSYDYILIQKYRNKIQKKFRQLAEKGTLMINKQKFQSMSLKFDQKILKKIKKHICDKQYQFFSLNLQTISIECLYWILQSIKEDKMMPSEKLILSRLKESFNIKPSSKLWSCIIKYLQSNQYLIDKQQFDKIKQIPKIHINMFNDQILFEYQRKWIYQDQYETDSNSKFAQINQEEWQLFKKQLHEFFKFHKQITGGRYGCVQYIKVNGPEKLRNCSLGKLSYYVQQAINKGFIRYHKTLLIQNQSFQKHLNQDQNHLKLFGIQKQLKIMIVQFSLIDIFLQSGQQNQISLAQIPLQLKKKVLFDINLLELGFPKLKNILQTLSDKLSLSSSKSHIKYQSIKSEYKISQSKLQLQLLLKNFIVQISQVIIDLVNKTQNIIVQQLYNMTNTKLGFVFDYRVCNVGDFCQFLLYYCQQSINLQFINGTFIAFSKHINNYNYQNYLYSNYMIQNEYNYRQNEIHQYNDRQIYPNHNQEYKNYSMNYQNIPLNYGNTYNHSNNINRSSQQKTKNYNLQQNYQNNLNYLDNYQINTTSKINSFQQFSSYQQNNKNHSSQLNNMDNKNYNQHKNKETNTLKNIPEISQNSTPKFNQSIQYINKYQNHNIKTLNDFKWQTYMNILPNFQETQDPLMSNIQTKYNNNQQNQSFTDFQSIYNILDDDNSQAKSKISYPKTFIEKQGSFNNINEQGQLYISKITPIDEKSDPDQQYDGSFGFFDQSPKRKDNNKVNLLSINYNQNQKVNKKGQHNRVYSTTQHRTKHERMYSTTTAKN